MLKKLNFKLGIISALFTLAVCALIPTIPIKINNSLLIIDSNLGGYILTINNGKWVIDLSKFKYDLDFGGGNRLVYKPQDEEKTEEIKNILEERLKLANYSKYNLSTEDNFIYVDIPDYGKFQVVTDLITRRGIIVFKELKPDYEWDIGRFNETIQDNSAWQDTQLDQDYFTNITYLLVPDPQDQTKTVAQVTLNMTNEGRQLFKQVLERNIDKPVGLFIDNSPVPIAAPIISAQAVQTFSGDPRLTGNFNEDLINNLGIQVQTGPYPSELVFTNEEKVPTNTNREMLNSVFMIAGAVQLFLLITLVVKYRSFGYIPVLNLIFTAVMSLVFIKGLPVLLNYYSISAYGIFVILLNIMTVYLILNISKNLKKDSPFNLSFHKVNNELKTYIKKFGIAFLTILLLSLFFMPENIGNFIKVIVIGISLSMFSIFFVLPTLAEIKSAFALKEKKK